MGGGGGEPLTPPAFAPVGKRVYTQINYLNSTRVLEKEYSMNEDLWTVKILELHESENIFLSVARMLLLENVKKNGYRKSRQLQRHGFFSHDIE